MAMSKDFQKIADVLDKTNHRWQYDWADHTDLRDLATGYINLEAVRTRIANRLFHSIVTAAVQADLVTLK